MGLNIKFIEENAIDFLSKNLGISKNEILREGLMAFYARQTIMYIQRDKMGTKA